MRLHLWLGAGIAALLGQLTRLGHAATVVAVVLASLALATMIGFSRERGRGGSILTTGLSPKGNNRQLVRHLSVSTVLDLAS